jgi:hypothetical protein
MTFEEAAFESALITALNEYIKQVDPDHNFGGCYPPSSTNQSPKDLRNARAFDLVKRLNDSSLLVLELKIKIGKSLKKPNDAQHTFYRALQDYGVPIDYCYNLVVDYLGKNTTEYTLNQSKVSSPELLFSAENIIDEPRHITLKESVDALLARSAGGGQDVIGKLIAGGVLADIGGLSTRILLLAYHSQSRKIMLLYPEQFIALARDIVHGIGLWPMEKAKMSSFAYVKHELDEVSALIARKYAAIQDEEFPDEPDRRFGM